MNWTIKIKRHPNVGIRRTITKFAWRPKLIWKDGDKEQWAWLEKYESEQEFNRLPRYIGPWTLYDYKWIEIKTRLLNEPTPRKTCWCEGKILPYPTEHRFCTYKYR